MRPTIDETMLAVASALAARGDCAKRQVGCVLTDKRGRIIGSGYNGKPRCMANCSVDPCRGGCDGVHAEINALLQCHGDDVDTAYVTHAPCWHCTKALLNTSCSAVIFLDATTEEPRAKELWQAGGRRVWRHSC